MARSERHEGGPRSGVGTITRPGPGPRPRQAPAEAGDRVPAAPEPRRGRQPRPVPPQRPGPDPRVPAQAAAAARRGAGPAAAAPARPGARLRAATPWRVSPAERAAGPQPAAPARTTGPQPAVPQGRPAPAAGGALGGRRRMPFVLLLCGLLGGALISALVISTTLAEGSFQINKLQDSTSSLARQRQTLQEQVAQGQSAQVIEQRAAKLGMRRPNELQFVNLKTGKVTSDGPTWNGAVNAPGYAP